MITRLLHNTNKNTLWSPSPSKHLLKWTEEKGGLQSAIHIKDEEKNLNTLAFKALTSPPRPPRAKWPLDFLS